MARRIHTEEETAETTPAPAEAALEGGALGVPDAANNQGGAEVALSNRVFEPSTAKKFEVQRSNQSAGAWRINMSGGITYLHAGQIIDENNYDIAGLRRAGVELKAIEG